MHGRPREAKNAEQDPEKRAIAEQKVPHTHCASSHAPTPAQAKAFGALCNEVLTRRAAKLYDAQSLAMCAALLELNPEMYSGWNYRREALIDVLLKKDDDATKVAVVTSSHAQPMHAHNRQPRGS